MEQEENIVQTEVTTDEATPQPIDFAKELQSARSKAKNEILKSLGIESVEQGLNKMSQADSLADELDKAKASLAEMEKSMNGIKSEYDGFRKSTLYKSLGVPDESVKDFEAIVNSRVDEEHSFETVAKEVADKYFANKQLPTFAPSTDQQEKVKPKYNTYGW